MPSGGGPAEGGVEYEVICVTRAPLESGYSRIARLGIKSDGGVRHLTEEEVVRHIRAGERFYVLKNGHKAYLKISISERGRPFVETIADRTTVDNLAALPTCNEDDRLRQWWLPLWLLLLTLLLCVIIWLLLYPRCPCPPPQVPPCPSCPPIIVTQVVTQTVVVTRIVVFTQTVPVTVTQLVPVTPLACLLPTATTSPAGSVEFLKNGDFEEGFRQDGVGTNWFSFNNGGEHVTYSYHDDTWSAVALGCHSQLVEINTLEFSDTLPDRFAGIGQSISGLKPGSEYQVALYGEIRTSEGDRNTDNLSYVVEWGVDPDGGSDWKAVNEWHFVPWNHVYFRSSPDPPGLRKYSTPFVARSSKVTLFIRLLKKLAKPFNELLLNLDGLSLSALQ